LFRNFRIHIFAYYFLTVSTFLFVEYYFLTLLEGKTSYLLAVVLLCFVILSGVFISKLAIDPLVEYVKNLQNLSKETLHELNLPISTIITNLQLLRKSIVDEKSVKRLGRIESACEMLKQRYNELEYLIKTQSKQEIKERFCVHDLVVERVAFLERIYPQVSFHLELQKMEIFGDKIGLTKVIDNLIDNAIKYSKDSKSVRIELKQNTLCIVDYGIGMDEVEIVKIFDQFYQVNSSMKGFGIGLKMVKRFCDENNIILNLQSTPNVGTKVELQFKI
jgi:signal transduction histidine kinase